MRMACVLEDVGQYGAAATQLAAITLACENAAIASTANANTTTTTTTTTPTTTPTTSTMAQLAHVAEVRLGGLLGCRQELLDASLALYEEALDHRLLDAVAALGIAGGAAQQNEGRESTTPTTTTTTTTTPTPSTTASPNVIAAVGAAAALLLSMANICRHAHSYVSARAYVQQALELRLRAHGRVHPDVAICASTLGDVCRLLGQPARALEYNAWALRIREQCLGPDAKVTLDTRYNVALLHKRLGQYSKSKDAFEEVASGLTRVLGPDHDETRDAMHQAQRIAALLSGDGKDQEEV